MNQTFDNSIMAKRVSLSLAKKKVSLPEIIAFNNQNNSMMTNHKSSKM